MATKRLVLILSFVLLLSLLSCGDGQPASPENSGAQPDILSYLREPGKITHIRYTTYTPPWPTRTEAWIDWDHNRIRSWNVEWTDSPTNPSVCTSIQADDSWYVCLPSLYKEDAPNGWRTSVFSPTVPLRASKTELSIALPSEGASGDDAASRIKIGTNVDTTHESRGDMGVNVRSWPITSELDARCPGGDVASARFDYTTTDDGEPISELINVTCGEQRLPYIGVLYHDVEFVDPSNLPADFFDVDAAQRSLISDEMSSAAAQLGTMFWLGEEAGDWKLDSIDQRPGYGTVTYSRGDGADQEVVELTTRSLTGILCDNPEPIQGDQYGGRLCIDASHDEYRVVWDLPGSEVVLEKQSYPEEISRDDLLALAGSLEQWNRQAQGPLLTSNEVRDLVADSLELVCPNQLGAIREARSQASFSFDRKSGEWTGTFGVLGEYAVPDAKPVAIPVDERTAVDSTLSHNAAQFADCGADEQPPPQEGDDEFAVKFVRQDDSGFWFEVTGVGSDADAALSFCMLADGGCVLRDPDGNSVPSRGVDIAAMRAEVYRIHWGVDADELRRSGTWTITVDLGGGKTTSTTYDVR